MQPKLERVRVSGFQMESFLKILYNTVGYNIILQMLFQWAGNMPYRNKSSRTKPIFYLLEKEILAPFWAHH